MKVEITKAQIEAIKSMTDDISSMAGQTVCDDRWFRYVRLVDRFLNKNNLPPRNFT